MKRLIKILKAQKLWGEKVREAMLKDLSEIRLDIRGTDGENELSEYVEKITDNERSSNTVDFS